MPSANLTLNLDADALREATTQAIVGTLTPEVRETLLKNAVTELLAPKDRGSMRAPGPSAIQEAFNNAIERVAFQEAEAMLASDGATREHIRGLLRSGVEKLLEMNADALADKFAEAIRSGLGRDY